MDEKKYFDKDALDFNKFNVIYGYNGCGKSTLSNMLSILDKSFEVPEDSANFILKFENNDGSKDSQLGIGTPFRDKEELDKCRSYFDIKVFNREYIENNIFSKKNKLKFIIRIGDAGKKAEGLEEKETKAKSLKKELDMKENSKIALVKEFSDWMTSEARNFATYCNSNSIPVLAHFSKTQFEKLLSRGETFIKLEKNEIDKYIDDIKKEKLEDIPVANFKNEVLYPNFNEEVNNVLLFKPSVKKIIERLMKNNDLNNWVRVGKENYIIDNLCPFCNKKLDKSFIDDLDNHYNDENKKVIKIAETLIEKIKIADENLSKISLIGKEKLYKDLYDDFNKTMDLKTKEDIEYKKYLTEIKQLLTEKIKNVYETNYTISEKLQKPTAWIEKYKNICSENNKITQSIDSAKKTAENNLKDNLLVEAQKRYIDYNKRLEKTISDFEINKKVYDEISAEISTIKSTLKAYVKTCDEINKTIYEYWGKANFKLVPEEDGYVIKRETEESYAKNLSEGEKTAIAFAYFLKSLEDDSFDLKKGIVVIDDPINSLDSNSIFTVFALIRRRISEANQVLILTHSFLFLNEIKQWFDKDEKNCNYYFADKCEGNLFLKKLPSSLLKCNSDYNYLFERLYNISGSTEDMSIEQKYTEANNLRRLLETFLNFKFPKKDDLFIKIFNKSKTETIDDIKKTRIFKYCNLFSHDDGSLGLYGQIDMNQVLLDSKIIIKDALQFIKEVDEQHYKSMEETILCSKK